MTATLCHRCAAELTTEPDGVLIFCAHCGAPQVWLSEELQQKAEALHLAGNGDALEGATLNLDAPASEAGATNASTTAASTEIVWRSAIHLAALSTALTAVLMLLSLAFPPLAMLTLFWLIASPVVVVGVYHSRFPDTRLGAGIGARFGLITGLFFITAMSVIDTTGLAISRHLHALGDFDSRLTAMIQQASVQAEATSGGDNPFLHFMALPEFRVGLLLAGVAMAAAMLLTLTTAGGAFAGMMRARPLAKPGA